MRSFFTINQGRAQRAGRLAAQVVQGALRRTGIGCELSGRGWQAGAMRPRGPSPLPVRPLRLRPITATAGDRACVIPGTARTNWPPSCPPATVRAEPRANRQRSSMKPAKAHSCVLVRESHPRR